MDSSQGDTAERRAELAASPGAQNAFNALVSRCETLVTEALSDRDANGGTAMVVYGVQSGEAKLFLVRSSRTDEVSSLVGDDHLRSVITAFLGYGYARVPPSILEDAVSKVNAGTHAIVVATSLTAPPVVAVQLQPKLRGDAETLCSIVGGNQTHE